MKNIIAVGRFYSCFLLIGIIVILFSGSAVFALPDNFSITVNVSGVNKTLVLSRHSVRASNILITTWDSSNGYVNVHDALGVLGPDAFEVRTYRGYVSQTPNELVTAVILADNTLRAEGHSGKGELWNVSGINASGITEASAGTPSASLTAQVPGENAYNTGEILTPSGVLQPQSYMPPSPGIYRAHAVFDIPSQFFNKSSYGNGNVETTVAVFEDQLNKDDLFNVRDAQLSKVMSQMIIRKDQFYDPVPGDNGNSAGWFTGSLRSEWDDVFTKTGRVNPRAFIASLFPYNFGYAGGYASGNNFYASNEPVCVNAFYHENAHNWRASHYYYGRDTMNGSHRHHGELNAQKVLYTRSIEIGQGDIQEVFDYPTNLHPYATLDLATTMVDTSVDIPVLNNDWDCNGDVISVRSHITTTAQGGTVTSVDDTLTYTPASGYVGKDIIVYEVQDSLGLYTIGLVHVEVINRSLAAYWAFEETTGSVAVDSSGNGHDGSLVSGTFNADSVDGVIGNAITVMGNKGMICDAADIIAVPEVAYPLESRASNFFDPMNEDYSVAFWFKASDLSSTVTLVDKGNKASFGYSITASEGKVSAVVRQWNALKSSVSVSGNGGYPGTWSHVTMVINRSTDTLKMFINGVAGTTASLTNGSFIFEGRTDMIMGTDQWNGGPAVEIAFDELMIYTEALDAGDIAVLMSGAQLPAGAPNPSNGKVNVGTDTNPVWLAGKPSYQHDVYFGTDRDAVANATVGSDEYQGRETTNTFDPGQLQNSTNYYWRVDEVAGEMIIPGEVWMFSTTYSELGERLLLHLTMDDEDVHTQQSGDYQLDDISIETQNFSILEVTTGAAGQIGEALSFDGSNDSVQSVNLNAIEKDLDSVSISFWVNTTSTAASSIYNVEGAYVMLYNNGDLRPFFDGSSSGADTFNTNINDGQWHHIVVMNNGARTTTVYVDGSVAGTDSESLHTLSGLERNMAIGSQYDGSGEHFDGLIDDFAVWGRTLGIDEIQSIYESGLVGETFTGPPILVNSSCEASDGFTGFKVGGTSHLGTVVDNDGVIWTEISDALIWNRTDIPPDGVQAIVMGINSTNSSFMISFDGVDHGVGVVTFDYAAFSSATDADVSLSYRVDSGAWVEVWTTHMSGNNPAWGTKPWPTVVAPINAAGDVDLLFKAVGTKGFKIDNVIVFDKASKPVSSDAPSFDSDIITLSDSIEGLEYDESVVGLASDPDGESLTYSKVAGPEWLSIAFDGVVTGTPGDGDVGINGFIVKVSDASGLEDTAVLYVPVLNVCSGNRGIDDLLGLARNWLAADCIDVPACVEADLDRDHDVTLADFASLSANWNVGHVAGLVGHWSMDDAAGFSVRDNYGDLDGILNGTDETACWGEGISGNALILDGIDDYAEIDGYFGVVGTGARTVSAWIQTEQISEGTIVSWGQSTYPWGGQWSVLVSGGKLRVNIGYGYAIASTIINDGQWHHVTVVLPELVSPVSADIQLYVDGSLETLSGYNSVAIDTRSGNVPVPVAVGRSAYGKNSYFSGKIDELRIYNIALRESEIAGL